MALGDENQFSSKASMFQPSLITIAPEDTFHSVTHIPVFDPPEHSAITTRVDRRYAIDREMRREERENLPAGGPLIERAIRHIGRKRVQGSPRPDKWVLCHQQQRAAGSQQGSESLHGPCVAEV